MEEWKNIAIKINKQNWTEHQLVVLVREMHWAYVRKEKEYVKIIPSDSRFLQNNYHC